MGQEVDSLVGSHRFSIGRTVVGHHDFIRQTLYLAGLSLKLRHNVLAYVVESWYEY
jgi:hypothetical protein